ncbi:hypothetical protein P3342_008947 [Pyrenophora teres f. teres]|nr:hypothetical protein P3342_008947 [Pyrenophora teres f. teres]
MNAAGRSVSSKHEESQFSWQNFPVWRGRQVQHSQETAQDSHGLMKLCREVAWVYISIPPHRALYYFPSHRNLCLKILHETIFLSRFSAISTLLTSALRLDEARGTG